MNAIRARDFEPWEVDLHGHRAVYHAIGDGPPVVLIHGMVNSSRHWREVALRLADRHTVIAPDCLDEDEWAERSPPASSSIAATCAPPEPRGRAECSVTPFTDGRFLTASVRNLPAAPALLQPLP